MENQFLADDDSELSDDYKAMIDAMLERKEEGAVEYISYENIKNRFMRTSH